METCQACNTTADYLLGCDRKDCPVASYYENLEREHLGDPETKTGIYHPDNKGTT